MAKLFAIFVIDQTTQSRNLKLTPFASTCDYWQIFDPTSEDYIVSLFVHYFYVWGPVNVSMPVIVFINVCVTALECVSVSVSVLVLCERRTEEKLLHMHFCVPGNHHYHIKRDGWRT